MSKWSGLVVCALATVSFNTGCILESAFEVNQALALIATVLELLPA